MPRKYTPEERITAFWAKVDKSGGEDACWIWTASTTEGYGRVRWCNRNWLAHRIVYKLTHGTLEEDILVLHKCDNRPCCNPKHLFLGTVIDNNADRDRKGRGKKRHRQHKLSDIQVAEIRQKYAVGGTTYHQLTSEYGVSAAYMWMILKRRIRI